jgi:hypothetical protein
VFLLTDGAPNCDLEDTCGANKCIPNIERVDLGDGLSCDDSFNCCAPDLAPHLCLDDDDAIEATAELRELGVATYVIGIPGSEVYADVLSAMAKAAGTARKDERAYYAVEDTAQLAQTLSQLGEELSLSCEFELDHAPKRPDLAQVFIDDEKLSEGRDGYSWLTDRTLLLEGDACAAWQAGDIRKVQVFEGCLFTMR